MISKKTKYALKALGYLARHSNGRHVLIAELAAEERIPRKFLEFILLALRKGGLLTSRIGKGGGYRLALDPAEITIGSIVKILEGDFSLVHCLDGNGLQLCEDGNDPACCGIHLTMVDMKSALTRVFEATSLADIIRKGETANRARSNIIDYCI